MCHSKNVASGTELKSKPEYCRRAKRDDTYCPRPFPLKEVIKELDSKKCFDCSKKKPKQGGRKLCRNRTKS